MKIETPDSVQLHQPHLTASSPSFQFKPTSLWAAATMIFGALLTFAWVGLLACLTLRLLV